MARTRCSQLAEHMIQMAYLVGDGQWDRASQECISHNITLSQLAGIISQLLPVGPGQDAPKV